MDWWLKHIFEKKRSYLEKRAEIIKTLRMFFDSRDFMEVHTPALQVCPVMDAHIHAFKTVRYDVGRGCSQEMYLHTSPEFDMKKLLAAGMERIYQMCPVYRNAEGSPKHSPEFMILEWYRSGADYRVLMDDCEELLRVTGLCDSLDRISVEEAFKKYAAIDLIQDRDKFAALAQGIGVRVVDTDRWDDIFHAVMADRIEPQLKKTILYDYPVSMAALSRKKEDDSRYAERFELYVNGVELANAFSELTDSKEQRRRYEEEMRVKQALYGEVYPPDEDFFAALDHMPESAGIALGVERLIMLAAGALDIHDVMWAPVQVK